MERTPRARPRKSLAERTRILAAYTQGQDDPREFARRHGIAPSTLYRWLQRRRSQPPPVVQAGLIEIPNPLGAAVAAPSYQVRFARGLTLEVSRGFDPGEVRSLLELIHQL